MSPSSPSSPPPTPPPSLAGRLSTPVLAPLLADRRLSAILAAAGAAQVALTLLHVGGMPCPFVAVTGRPCPGCGLSRASAAVCRGRWADAAQLHAFAPCFLVAIGLFAATAALPTAARGVIVRAVTRLERRSYAGPMLAAAMLLYWAIRLRYAPAEVSRILMLGG